MNAFTSYIKAINALTAIDFSNVFSNAFSIDNTNSVSTIKPDNTLIENDELKALSGIQFVDILRDSNFINDDSIDGYKIKPVDVVIQEEDETGTVMKMSLYEGRNRQIRKMCEQAGLTVKRLSRVSIGNLKLDGLPVGKWRYLDEKEVDYLYKATK